MKINITRIRKLKLTKDDIVFIEYDPEMMKIHQLDFLYDYLDKFIGKGKWMLYEKGTFTKIKCINKEEK